MRKSGKPLDPKKKEEEEAHADWDDLVDSLTVLMNVVPIQKT